MRRIVLTLSLLLSACARAPLPLAGDAAGDAGHDAGAQLIYCGQDQDCPCGQRCIGGACAAPPRETR